MSDMNESWQYYCPKYRNWMNIGEPMQYRGVEHLEILGSLAGQFIYQDDPRLKKFIVVIKSPSLVYYSVEVLVDASPEFLVRPA